MSLAEKLEAGKPAPKKSQLELYIEGLSDADRHALIAAARDKAWTTSALLRVLKSEGVAVGKDLLGVWRSSVSRG